MKRLIVWIFLAAVLLAACVPQAAPTAAPAPTEPDPGSGQPSDDDFPAAVQAAIEVLAAAIQVDRDQVSVVEFEHVDWPDGCLGIQRIDALCAAVITPGYRVVLDVDGRQYEMHTNEDGSALAPAFEGTPAEKDAAVAAAIRHLAGELGVSVDEIVVGLTESAEWPDSCLGQWAPGTACADVITPGYRVILTHAGSEYELHTNHNGSQVVSVTVALNWHREGGIAGFNDFMVIYRPDSLFASREGGEPLARTAALRSVLSETELAQWNRWQAKFGQVEIRLQDDASADGMTTTLSFSGFGSQQPSPIEEEAMLTFAQDVFNRLMQ